MTRSLLLDAAWLRAQESTVNLGPTCQSSNSQIAAVELPVVVCGDNLGNLAEVASRGDLVKNDAGVDLSRLAGSAGHLGLERNNNTLAALAGSDIDSAGVSETRVLERVNVRQIAGLRGQLDAIALNQEGVVVANQLPNKLRRHDAKIYPQKK